VVVVFLFDSNDDRWAENFTLGLIPEASHWVQQDAPRSVNEKIREFL
jgi:pimeloyl-ACP methyl ester carboxylesterase